MTWRTEWAALSNQIQGLIEAGHFLFQVQATRDKSTENQVVFKNVFRPHSEVIRDNIQKFLEMYESNISTPAVKCMKNFITTYQSLCSNREWTRIATVQTALTLLASFRSEVSYHLSDIQAVSRRLTERAFIHLQRSIVADPSIRERWKKAFDVGEPHCEKLGAAHLLSHGVWAFKTSAEGERTDLILCEPLRDLSTIQSAAEALVLTEWKAVRDPQKELKRKAEQAFKQAKRYACGLLAGLELANYRYLVIVSQDNVDMPADLIEDDVNYKYFNVAVDPSTPSRS